MGKGSEKKLVGQLIFNTNHKFDTERGSY